MIENKRLINIFLFSFLLFVCLSCNSNGYDRETFKVKKVIDGDTIILDNSSKSHLRYLGIDTPEKSTYHSPSEPYAKEATEYNRKLVEGRKIEVELDEEKYDQYGRLLGYVFVDGEFINKKIIEQGLAHLLIIEPNTRYKDILENAENRAIKNRSGIWSNPDSYEYSKKNKKFTIKPLNAKRYIDQRIVARGKITSTDENKKVVILDMENELYIVIFRDDIQNFVKLGINPRSYYTGSPVEVIGRVKMYRGNPQIVVDHPISIRKLN